MKNFLIPSMIGILLLAACGEQPVEEANPLSVVPENSMMIFTLNDPAGVVRNIDGYIEDGAPILGEDLLENLICAQLEIATLDSMAAVYGFDPSGTVVFWMENAMPTSMGMAASAPDVPLFLSLMEDLGAEFIEEEPVDGNPVYSMDTGDGTVYITGKSGVVLMTMSSSRVETLLEQLSGEGYEVAPTSLTMHFNLALIGPMVAAQMPMARTMMMQGISEDPDMPQFVPAMMDVYFDGFEILFTEADQMTVTTHIGPEDLVITKEVTFIEGSQLAGMLHPMGGRDMLELIPAGDMATVRFRMPPEIAFAVTKAFTEVFTTEIPEENLQFWSQMAANGGVSIYRDEPMHMVAAYEAPEGITLQEIAVMYSEYMALFTGIFADMPDMEELFTLTDNGIVEIDGIEFYSMEMEMTIDTLSNIDFSYWITLHEGALLLELGDEPVLLQQVMAGDYVPAQLEAEGDMAGEMSLAGYFEMIMAFSPEGIDLPEISSDVLIMWDGGYTDGGMLVEMRMNGRDALATGFALFGLLSATM